jgi:RNA polymerase sigma factor (sigma-70 family)
MSRILIVDDEPAVTKALQSLLRLERIDTAVAFDRPSAESLAASEHFPLILADLRLHTEEEGFALLHNMKDISPRSRVATLTGLALPDVEERALSHGAWKVLYKSIPPLELLALLKQMLADIEAMVSQAPTPETIALLHGRVTRVLYAIAHRQYHLTIEEADDLVQQAWLLYLQRPERVAQPAAWLAGTVLNLCRQQIRYNTASRARETVLEASELRTPEPSPLLDSRLIIDQILACLDERSRQLVRLIGIEGCSYEETSQRLNIAQGSVGPLYLRAKNRLRRALITSAA